MLDQPWSEAFINNHFFNCADIVFFAERQGQILAANPSCIEGLGYQQMEIIGSSIEAVLDITKDQRSSLDKYIEDRQSYKFDTNICRSDGSTLPASVSVSPIQTGEESQVSLFYVTDRSGWVESKTRLQQKINQQILLIEAAGQLTKSLDLNVVLEQIGHGAKRILSAVGCCIYLLESDRETLTPFVSLDPYFDEEILATSIDIYNSLPRQAVNAKRSLIFNNVIQDENGFHGQTSPASNDDRIMVVPLIVQDDVFGAMCLKRQGVIFSENDLKLAEGFATYAATAIKNARAHDRLQREMERRLQVEKALKDTEHEQTIILDAVEELIVHLDQELQVEWINRAAIESVDYSRQEMLGKHCYTIWHKRHEPCLGCPVVKAFNTGRQHEAEIFSSAGRVWYIKAYPVLDKEGQVASVVEVSREITFQRQRDREQKAIIQLSTALRSAGSLNEMFPIIVHQIHDLINAHGTALGLCDPSSGEVVLALGTGGAALQTGTRFPGNKGITGHAMTTKQPYIHNDVITDELLYMAANAINPRSLAVFPLIAQAEPIGALYVGKDFDFSESDIHILTALSELVANAIQRAKFHEEIQHRLQRLDALHKIDLAITASMDLKLTLNIILDHVTSQLQVDAADVLVLNPHTQTLDYKVGRGFKGNTIHKTSLRLGEGCPGLAALNRQIVILPNLNEADCFSRQWLLSGENLVAYFGVPLVAKGEVKGVLELFHRETFTPDREWLSFLDLLAGQAAIAIDGATLFENLQRSNLELAAAYTTTLEGWARALELRDRETEGHTRRVTEMTMRLCSAMGIRPEELVHIQRGAMLHDIGKMGIPDSILTKPGSLTDDEWVIMKQHPVYARDLLASIPYLRLALDIPYCHHEKWDGSGYPRGLKGDEIPLAARIFALIDVWDALLSDRPYRNAWPEENVLEYLQDQAGMHFDPEIVDAFFALLYRNQLVEMSVS